MHESELEFLVTQSLCLHIESSRNPIGNKDWIHNRSLRYPAMEFHTTVRKVDRDETEDFRYN
jgi:hypothetical protein